MKPPGRGRIRRLAWKNYSLSHPRQLSWVAITQHWCFYTFFEFLRDDKGHLWNLCVAAEKKAEIKAAIAKVQSGAGGCIKFMEVEKSSPQFKLSITPFNPDKWVEQSYVLKMSSWSTHGSVIIWIHSSKAERCSSYPGRYLPFAGTHHHEQRLTLVGGPKGCIDEKAGSLRHLMLSFHLCRFAFAASTHGSRPVHLHQPSKHRQW